MTESLQTKLLYNLCVHFAGATGKDCNIAHIFNRASQTLSQYVVPIETAQNEIVTCEQIRRTIQSMLGDDQALTFVELHRKLKTLPIPRNRCEILCLLFSLRDMPGSAESISTNLLEMNQNSLPRMQSLSSHRKECLPEGIWENNNTPNNGTQNSIGDSTGTRPHALSYLSPRVNIMGSKEQIGHSFCSTKLPSPVAKPYSSLAAYQQQVSEHVLIQELLYSFQGIEGKVLKLDTATSGFVIDRKVHLLRPQRRLVERLSELGWLHNKLQGYTEAAKSQSSGQGLLAQALHTVVTDEITELYRILAILQSQLHQQNERGVDSPMSEGAPRSLSGSRNSSSHSMLSLLQLQVHMSEPLQRLRWLVAICESCQEKKGGALASAVHGFLQHGDPFVQKVVHTLLAAVCKPFYGMLSRWILDGKLQDPFDEFFIQTNPNIQDDNQLWHDMYKVRQSMVPSFISIAQAQKILATGKSINFLRQVCEDHSPVNSSEMLRHALENSSAEAIFLLDRHADLQGLMDTAYLEISRRVLDILNRKYKVMEHLQALRRYLLLGQGDFIRHLMELLEPELHKPASDLYSHNMTGILESAIRATNAQFEDASILERLDVRLLEQSPGDTGWDVFSLDYRVHGPISTVFSSSMLSYLVLFNALWRAKRMEWILSQMWKRLNASAKVLPKIPELAPVLQQTYFLCHEMIHLIHQLQYYFLFEVMECSWDKLISNVQQADSLDDIIKAHHQFLERIKAGALVDDASQKLGFHLRTIYDLVLQLQSHEENLHSRIIREIQRQEGYETHIQEHGTNLERESLNQQACKEFTNKFLSSMRVSLAVLAQSYQDVVKKFLLMLASHADINLQLLSHRIDFNDHFKRHDSRLTVPLTYQHRRQSEVVVPSTSSMSMPMRVISEVG